MLLNLAIGGGSWKRHGIRAHQVKEINGKIAWGLPSVWEAAEAILVGAIEDGDLPL